MRIFKKQANDNKLAGHFTYMFLFINLFIGLVFLSCNPVGNNNHAKGSDTSRLVIKKNKAQTDEDSSGIKNENKQQQAGDTAAPLYFLNSCKGKYPFEVNLLDNAVLKPRLMKMLGERYAFIKNIWEVETKIEINKGLFYAWGMLAHTGGNPEAIIMADISRNVLYAGIREGDNVKIYSEDGSNAPQKLLDWEQQ
jgi:hypothetical protein